MSILIDVGIVILLVSSIIMGYRKGLIRAIFSIVSFIIAIILAFLLYKPVAAIIINSTSIDEVVKETIRGKYDVDPNMEVEQITLDENTAKNFPETVTNYINKNIIEDAKNTTINAFADQIARIIINIAAMIIVFIIVKLLMLLLKSIFDAIAKLPIIKPFNKLGGIIYGILRGVIMAYLIFAVIAIIVPAVSWDSAAKAINNSKIGSSMYNNNILLKIIF